MDEVYERVAHLEGRLEEGGQALNSSHVQSKPGSSSTMKPPTFDGETSREKGLDVLQNVPETSQPDYLTLMSMLELRFGNKHLSKVYQSQLKSRTQGSSESLQEFCADIERMVILAYRSVPEEFVRQISIQ